VIATEYFNELMHWKFYKKNIFSKDKLGNQVHWS